MEIREYKNKDREQVEEILKLYWNDKDFRDRFLNKLDLFVRDDKEIREKQYHIFVAEENNEIVGIASFRIAPEFMKQFATTNNPGEFHLLASKYKRKGIGEILRKKGFEEAIKLGFTEILLYSSESHKDSWGFHDGLGFVRIGPALAPDGEPGMIWHKII